MSYERAVCKHGYLTCRTCEADVERVKTLQAYIWSLFPIPEAGRPKGMYAAVDPQCDDAWLRLYFNIGGHGSHIDVSTATQMPAEYYESVWYQLFRNVSVEMRRDLITVDTWLFTNARKGRPLGPPARADFRMPPPIPTQPDFDFGPAPTPKGPTS